MLPLGVLMIGTCIPYFYRRIRVWMRRLRNEIREAEQKDKVAAVSEQNDKVAAPSNENSKIARRSRRKIPRHRR